MYECTNVHVYNSNKWVCVWCACRAHFGTRALSHSMQARLSGTSLTTTGQTTHFHRVLPPQVLRVFPLLLCFDLSALAQSLELHSIIVLFVPSISFVISSSNTFDNRSFPLISRNHADCFAHSPGALRVQYVHCICLYYSCQTILVVKLFLPFEINA